MTVFLKIDSLDVGEGEVFIFIFVGVGYKSSDFGDVKDLRSSSWLGEVHMSDDEDSA